MTAAIVPAVADGVVGMAIGAAQGAAEAGGQGTGFSPVAPALILLLPLIGFAINGLGAYLWRDNRTIPTIVGPLAVA
ncbi:MAG: hypothetical protein ACOC9H_00475, partial [Gemmatimonadota bacterium]